jgi:hypothetical protein
MKDAIVIKIRETDKSLALDIQTDVNIAEHSKYLILLSLMRSLEMSVDWMNKKQVDAFSLKMLLASAFSSREEVNED